jgi:hypothetical protein
MPSTLDAVFENARAFLGSAFGEGRPVSPSAGGFMTDRLFSTTGIGVFAEALLFDPLPMAARPGAMFTVTCPSIGSSASPRLVFDQEIQAGREGAGNDEEQEIGREDSDPVGRVSRVVAGEEHHKCRCGNDSDHDIDSGPDESGDRPAPHATINV